MKTFKEFLIEQSIDEALMAKPVDYGTNYPELNDRKWKQNTYLAFNLKSTCFDGGDRFVAVDFNDDVIVFRTVPKTSSVNTIDYILSKASYDNKKQFSSMANAANIIQKVMFVLFDNIGNKKQVSFLGAAKLASIYKRLIESKYIKDKLEEHGFYIADTQTTATEFAILLKKE